LHLLRHLPRGGKRSCDQADGDEFHSAAGDLKQ
jgi:hypothetical protein